MVAPRLHARRSPLNRPPQAQWIAEVQAEVARAARAQSLAEAELEQLRAQLEAREEQLEAVKQAAATTAIDDQRQAPLAQPRPAHSEALLPYRPSLLPPRAPARHVRCLPSLPRGCGGRRRS